MPHGDLAQLSAVIGGLGAAAMLLARTRTQLLAGLAATAAAEIGLAAALIPGADLKLVVNPASHAAAFVVGLVAVGAGAWALARYPAVVPVALLAVAPFRISVSIGAQTAYLLVPLYVVLAAAMLAFAWRALHGDVGKPLPPLLAVPAAAFVALAGTSLLWTRDLRQGSIELLFFLFPFSALVVVGRTLAVAQVAPTRARDDAHCACRPFLRRRPLPTRDPRASARGRRGAGERVHDVLPRHLAVQGPERLRPSRRDRDRGAARRDLARPDRLLGRRRATHVPVGRSLLLVLAVELRRALRGRRRDLVRPRWTETAARAARGRRGLRARRRGVRRCRRRSATPRARRRAGARGSHA